jgi:hypothetical protein
MNENSLAFSCIFEMTFLPVTTELKGPKTVLCGFDNVIFVANFGFVLFGKNASPSFAEISLRLCHTQQQAAARRRQQQQQQFTAVPSTRSDLLHKIISCRL